MPSRTVQPRFAKRLSHAGSRRSAFTLIEVLLVVSVLAVIAGVVVPQVTSVVDEARNSAALVDLQEITLAIERYRLEHTGQPPDLIQNETLVQLSGKTDLEGNLGSGPKFIYGPYIPSIPKNALNGVARVFRINTAPPANLPNRVGWVYHPASGQMWAGLYPVFVDLAGIDADGNK